MENVNSRDPLVDWLEKDVSIAWDIVKYIVTKVGRKYAQAMALIDNDNNVSIDAKNETHGLIAEHMLSTRVEEENCAWEIQLSISNGGTKVWVERKIRDLEGEHKKQYKRTVDIIRGMEDSYKVGVMQNPQGFKESLDSNVGFARRQTEEILNNILTMIELNKIISDE